MALAPTRASHVWPMPYRCGASFCSCLVGLLSRKPIVYRAFAACVQGVDVRWCMDSVPSSVNIAQTPTSQRLCPSRFPKHTLHDQTGIENPKPL